jgi:hypothetical protein
MTSVKGHDGGSDPLGEGGERGTQLDQFTDKTLI